MTPAPAPRAVYGPLDLALFPVYQTTADYVAQTGKQPPLFDVGKNLKNWADPHAGDPNYFGRTILIGGTAITYTPVIVIYGSAASFLPDDKTRTTPTPVPQPIAMLQADAGGLNILPDHYTATDATAAQGLIMPKVWPVPIRALNPNERFWYQRLAGQQDSAVQIINIDLWKSQGLGPLPWEAIGQSTGGANEAVMALLEQIAKDVAAVRKVIIPAS